MLVFKGSASLRRIVVLNSKGGSGKTTLAFNLAGYLAATGSRVAVVDMDEQSSSMRWLHNRSSGLPRIIGLSVKDLHEDASGNQCVIVPEDIEYAVVDAPAGLPGDRLIDYTCGAHAIFVPVLPSDLDIHSASRLISDLLLKAQVSRRNQRLGVVANRVKERTVAYRQLRRFLSRLSIPVVGLIRDSQNYVWAAQNGRCLHEMPPSRVRKDLAQWEAMTQWLERRLAMPLTPRDLRRPAEPQQRKRPHSSLLLRAAAAIVMLSVSMVTWKALGSLEGDPAVGPIPASGTGAAGPSEIFIAQIPDTAAPTRSSEELEDRWQLNGVILQGASSVLILTDRVDKSSLRMTDDANLDGWIVADVGSDYAVFSQFGERVRLDLN